MPENENWFRARRTALELSQGDIAFAFAQRGQKLTTSAVSGWEAGQVPNINHVDDIAAVYRVKADEVLRVMHEMGRARKESASSRS